MNENEDFLMSMREADIYNELLDYMEYKKTSELLINLNAGKISDFFSQFITFKIPEEEVFIENYYDDDFI